MPNIITNQSAQTVLSERETEVLPRQVRLQTQSSDSEKIDFPSKVDLYHTSSSALSLSDENQDNLKRLELLKSYFTPQLIQLILESDFEYGIESAVDPFLREKIFDNALATKSWLNQIFVSNFGQPSIVIGILRAISRLPYQEINPEGQIMATAALSHKDIEVKECGIRAFENWGNLQSLNILENLKISPPWLQDYVERVAKGLREEYYVTLDKKDKSK